MAGAEETGTQRINNMGQGLMGIRMMGRRKVMPMWENDPVWLHDRIRRESGQGRVWVPPQTEIRQRSEKGRSGYEE